MPECTVLLGEPHSPLRTAFDESVEKVNDIFSMAGVDANSDETAHMIVAAWGTLSTLPEAVRLGKENSRDQLKRSRKFQQDATKAIFSGIVQRKQRDALLTTGEAQAFNEYTKKPSSVHSHTGGLPAEPRFC